MNDRQRGARPPHHSSRNHPDLPGRPRPPRHHHGAVRIRRRRDGRRRRPRTPRHQRDPRLAHQNHHRIPLHPHPPGRRSHEQRHVADPKPTRRQLPGQRRRPALPVRTRRRSDHRTGHRPLTERRTRSITVARRPDVMSKMRLGVGRNSLLRVAAAAERGPTGLSRPISSARLRNRSLMVHLFEGQHLVAGVPEQGQECAFRCLIDVFDDQ
jgi:hypothetical protein